MNEQIRILCVDDETSVLKAIKRLFIDEEYEILTATSGDEGLKILENKAPVQIVIADFRMPEMDGIDFLQEVRHRWPGTVRMALSGYGDTSTLVDAINQGQIYRFIPKPWKEKELKATVSDAVEQLSRRQGNPREPEKSHVQDQKTRSSGERLTGQGLTLPGSILESFPAAILAMDADGRITHFNGKSRELFNGQGETILGQDRKSILPEALNTLIEEIMEKGMFSQEMTLGDHEFEVLGERINDQGRDGLVLVCVERTRRGRDSVICG